TSCSRTKRSSTTGHSPARTRGPAGPETVFGSPASRSGLSATTVSLPRQRVITTRPSTTANSCTAPRTPDKKSVRLLVLPASAGLGWLELRRSLEQEAVERRYERVGRHHRVGVVDGAVLARECDPARALAQPVLELRPDLL